MTPTKIVLPPLDEKHSPNVSSRHGEKVHLIVVHRPVGSYEGSIRALMDPHHQASAHIIMAPGGKKATQLVSWAEKAWACKAFNSLSDNLEIADECWDGRDPHGLAVAARIVAFRCHKRGIPPLWTHEPLSKAGIVRHYDLGTAGGGHTDPTLDVSLWRKFILAVQHEVDRGGFRKVWGVGD